MVNVLRWWHANGSACMEIKRVSTTPACVSIEAVVYMGTPLHGGVGGYAWPVDVW